MTTKDKLITRFRAFPVDFTFQELKRMLSIWEYSEKQAEGSRVVFRNDVSGHSIKLHKPHTGNILKRYQMELIEKELKEKGLL